METPDGGKKDTERKGWRARHAEMWKFLKFLFAGTVSSAVELAAHLLLLEVILAGVSGEVHNPVFAFLHMSDRRVILAYMISTAIGYAIAFVMNRKISFKADANVALSIFLYVLMVIATIFANGWIGDNINSLFIHMNPALDAASNTTSALVQKIICMIIPTAWTYPCNRFIIHRKRKPESENNKEQ